MAAPRESMRLNVFFTISGGGLYYSFFYMESTDGRFASRVWFKHHLSFHHEMAKLCFYQCFLVLFIHFKQNASQQYNSFEGISFPYSTYQHGFNKLGKKVEFLHDFNVCKKIKNLVTWKFLNFNTQPLWIWMIQKRFFTGDIGPI